MTVCPLRPLAATVYHARMARRIKKANVHFISLCPRGANQLPTMYKEYKDGDALPDGFSKKPGAGEIPFTFDGNLVKSQELLDKGEVLAVVYAPDLPDSDGEMASAEVIEEAKRTFAKNGFQLDLRHNNKALSKADAYLVDNFTIQKGDPRFAGMKDYQGNPVDVSGGWGVLIKIENPELQELYRSGQWAGVSMGGTYLPEPDLNKAEETLLGRFLKLLDKHLPSSNKGDIDVDKTELAQMLKENNQELARTISAELAKALKPEGTQDSKAKTEEKPVAKESKTEEKPLNKADLKAVRAHRLKLEKEKLQEGVDWDDAESVAEYEARLEAFEKEHPEASAPAASTSSRIKPSNQGGADAVSTVGGEESCLKEMARFLPAHRLSKEMQALIK